MITPEACLSAAAGIMITASHNPPRDNGYKVYSGDGAQIIPPVDAEIEAAIGALGPLSEIPASTLADPRIAHYGDGVAQAYLDAILAVSPARNQAAARPAKPGQRALRLVYTPLHGVAAPLALRAFERAGFPAPHIVAAQAAPDPDFPTVAFPNPEEPGTLDLALAEARHIGADLVVANDPDGDRLAVAVPEPATETGWRVLTGDQVGALLGAYLLERAAGRPTAGADAGTPGPGTASAGLVTGHLVVATTVVSSAMLSKIAAATGARYVETLTGLKWIVQAADNVPGSRFAFGYEEALGYAAGNAVRDKDGISAALAILSLATTARAQGQSLLDRWDALERAHGVHLTGQLTLPARSLDAVMARLRAGPLSTLAGHPVTSTVDLRAGLAGLPPADVLIYRLPGARVAIRPSGTEPKLKVYLEIVERVEDGSLERARAIAAARLEPLREAVAALISSTDPSIKRTQGCGRQKASPARRRTPRPLDAEHPKPRAEPPSPA